MTIRSAVTNPAYEGTGEPKPPLFARDIFWVRLLAAAVVVLVLVALLFGGMGLWLVRVFFMVGFPLALVIWSVRRFKAETRWNISWIIAGLGIAWWLGATIFWSVFLATESVLLMFFLAWPFALLCLIWAICLVPVLDWWEERS